MRALHRAATAPGAVTVWLFAPEDLQTFDAAGDAWLSPDERLRAQRMADPARSRRFVRMRMALREVVGRQTGTPPGRLVFDVLPGGKPSLRDGRGWQFSLSHCGDHLALATARGGPLGLDLERVASRPRDELARRFFGPSALSHWAWLPMPARCHAFAWGWSEREAYLKALGLGLGDGWNVARQRLAGLPLHDGATPPDGSAGRVGSWRLHRLQSWPGFACVLCAPAGLRTLRVRHAA